MKRSKTKKRARRVGGLDTRRQLRDINQRVKDLRKRMLDMTPNEFMTKRASIQMELSSLFDSLHGGL